MAAASPVVEHLGLPGDDYRDRRLALVARAYDVQGAPVARGDGR